MKLMVALVGGQTLPKLLRACFLGYNQGARSSLSDDEQKLVSSIDQDMKPEQARPYARYSYRGDKP
jgi:hypothetical protein